MLRIMSDRITQLRADFEGELAAATSEAEAISLAQDAPRRAALREHLFAQRSDTAREILDPERAEAIADALHALAAVLAGDAAAGGFGDLETRPPQLPPHLRAPGEPSA